MCLDPPPPVAPSSAGSPSSDSCPGLSNGEEAGLEKPSLEPQKSLGEEGPQRGPDLGPADREDEEEDEEEEEQTDPKKPTTDEVRPAGGKGGKHRVFISLAFAEHRLCAGHSTRGWLWPWLDFLCSSGVQGGGACGVGRRGLT